MTTRELLLSAWAPGIAVPLLCLLAIVLYAARYRRRLQPRAAFHAAAVALFFVALASPIGVLARGYLFSAHMLQHLILVLAVPPLLLLGLPRQPDADPPREGSAGVYIGSWLAGAAAMWIWHERTLCNAAATVPAVQWLQTITLLLMGFAFWRPILAPRDSDRLPPFQGILYLFTSCVTCTVLGIMVTFSPVEVCNAYMHPVDSLGVLPLIRDGWGLSRRGDQELGGLMMWVPACFVYAAAILATLSRYYQGERPSLASAPARGRRGGR